MSVSLVLGGCLKSGVLCHESRSQASGVLCPKPSGSCQKFWCVDTASKRGYASPTTPQN